MSRSYAAVVFLVAGVFSVSSIISLDIPVWQSLVLNISLVVFCCYCITGLRPLYLMIKTLPRDIRYRSIYNRMSAEAAHHINSNNTIHKRFNEIVSKYPKKPAILFEDQIWTYKDLNTYSNKVSCVLSRKGFKIGDCIALFMTNCPQYVGILIGASKIGVEVALINYNLRDLGLLHCITVAKCLGIIYEKSLEEAIAEIHGQLSVELQSMCLCCQGEPDTNIGRTFDNDLQLMADESVPVLKEQNMNDVLCYIYTSGTTGLPKAVPIKYSKFNVMVAWYSNFTSISTDDVIYNTLPLYHSNGGILATGQCYTRGVTVALRRKFSASQFFSDCIKYKCTMFIYIGELCRYLVLQPPSVTDTQHSIKTCCGNGLRPDIWEAFQKRFAIPKIVEFYGSTEGTFFHANTDGKIGAIGSYSIWVKYACKIYFIKVDPTTGEAVRNSKGFCIEAKQGEVGEMIGALVNGKRYTGYKDSAAATSKRLLTDVFTKGDVYYHSGDIGRYDEEGYVYFCDRAGDTFRWKGENVSTTEVENTISSLIGQKDVIVYGVSIPDTEGRAGMAVIVGTPETVNLSMLCDGLKQRLPSYSIPVFIRFVDSSHLTGTFKFQKVQYRKDGFDVSLTGSDKVYVWDSVFKEYVIMTEQLYQKVVNGDLRF